jgi:peptidoglycan biosynthesis protein MviN/MurJ (putative lipid II flippase)
MVTALIEDEKAFAVFRYGAREFPLAVLMVGALATSLLPEAAENLEKGLQRIKTTTRRLSHLLYPLSMASMLAAPLLFPLIFNPDFKDSAKLFNIFTLLLSSRILLPQVVAMGQGKNYILTLSALAEMAVLLMLSYWLGTRFGLEGIAYAAILAFMVDRLILLFYNWKALGIHPGRYVDWKNYLAYNAALVAVFLVSLQY